MFEFGVPFIRIRQMIQEHNSKVWGLLLGQKKYFGFSAYGLGFFRVRFVCVFNMLPMARPMVLDIEEREV